MLVGFYEVAVAVAQTDALFWFAAALNPSSCHVCVVYVSYPSQPEV
jgi:hypothetical protein